VEVMSLELCVHLLLHLCFGDVGYLWVDFGVKEVSPAN